jgi:hypothetical protein
MNETKTLKARHSDGSIEECSIQIVESTDLGKLIFSGAGFQGIEFPNRDLFDALTSLRSALEKIGIQLLCAGARSDVFPSGMCRDMFRGRKAYILKLGFPARDFVDIFDYSDSQAVGSVSEQQAFYEKWFASL